MLRSFFPTHTAVTWVKIANFFSQKIS
jgi:hypothetical protein